MVFNLEKYHYRSRKKRRGRWVVLPLAVLLAAAVALGWVFRVDRRVRVLLRPESEAASLGELWNNRLYDEIIGRADARLESHPLDREALVYRGFACFYKAVSETVMEEKVGLLDEAIQSLRRSALVAEPLWPAERDYVLGKAYYHKGRYYYDLTIRFLQSALDQGYNNDDIYDYLGLACTELDRVEEGLGYFLKALESSPTDLLLLTVAQSYLKLKKVPEAREYLIRTINRTEDPSIEKKSRFQLGQILFDQGELIKAEEEYLSILKIDEQSADAHFYLGEVYAKLGDTVKARSEWRRTLVLDPGHYGARLRYYK